MVRGPPGTVNVLNKMLFLSATSSVPFAFAKGFARSADGAVLLDTVKEDLE